MTIVELNMSTSKGTVYLVCEIFTIFLPKEETNDKILK